MGIFDFWKDIFGPHWRKALIGLFVGTLGFGTVVVGGVLTIWEVFTKAGISMIGAGIFMMGFGIRAMIAAGNGQIPPQPPPPVP